MIEKRILLTYVPQSARMHRSLELADTDTNKTMTCPASNTFVVDFRKQNPEVSTKDTVILKIARSTLNNAQHRIKPKTLRCRSTPNRK